MRRLWSTVGKNTSIHSAELNQDEEQNFGNVVEFEVEEKNCWIEGVEDRSLMGFATSITGGVDSIYATEKGATNILQIRFKLETEGKSYGKGEFAGA